MPIRDLLLEIAAQWPSYAPKKTTDRTAPAYVLVTQTLPATLKALLGPDSSLKVEGSTGAGNITAAPWTGVFDHRLTSGATNGYYIVYLFAVDMQSVTLTIAFGTTQFETQFGGPQAAFPRMREAVGRLQGLFDNLVPLRYSRAPSTYALAGSKSFIMPMSRRPSFRSRPISWRLSRPNPAWSLTS